MEADIKEILAEHFNALPKVVQESITSSNVEEKLRTVAKKHNLHLDKWVMLENEVMMTLLGIQPIENLAANIMQETGITKEEAQSITEDASLLIFEPIRQELERELKNPNAQPKEVSSEETQRQEMIKDAHDAVGDTVATDTTPRSVHSTPSSVRTTIEGDPYREALK
jgi:glucose-6-phosphate-specific signal transduction histidine kinase